MGHEPKVQWSKGCGEETWVYRFTCLVSEIECMEGTLDKVMIPITPWNRLPKESDVSLQHLKSTQTRAQVLAFLGHSVSVHVNSQCSTTLVTQPANTIWISIIR